METFGSPAEQPCQTWAYRVSSLYAWRHSTGLKFRLVNTLYPKTFAIPGNLVRWNQSPDLVSMMLLNLDGFYLKICFKCFISCPLPHLRYKTGGGVFWTASFKYMVERISASSITFSINWGFLPTLWMENRGTCIFWFLKYSNTSDISIKYPYLQVVIC